MDVDYDDFYQKIWPVLVDRVPGFQTAKVTNLLEFYKIFRIKLQVKSAWSGYQDINTFDDAPVIGEHPLYTNLHMMCGFGERYIVE